MKQVLAIRHVPFEDLGAFAPVLLGHGFSVRYHEAGQDLDLDSIDRAALLVVLGGPIGVNDVQGYPFLAEEIAWIRRRLDARAPVMGICLGAQLLAAAAGAKVYRAPEPEIGFAPIELTPAGHRSCLEPFAGDPVTLHWHGDTFDLPQDATLLASTSKVANQAFSIGPRAIGFQFHPEASSLGFEQWLIGNTMELARAGIDPRRLRADMLRHGENLESKAAQVIDLWLDQADVKGNA